MQAVLILVETTVLQYVKKYVSLNCFLYVIH